MGRVLGSIPCVIVGVVPGIILGVFKADGRPGVSILKSRPVTAF